MVKTISFHQALRNAAQIHIIVKLTLVYFGSYKAKLVLILKLFIKEAILFFRKNKSKLDTFPCKFMDAEIKTINVKRSFIFQTKVAESFIAITNQRAPCEPSYPCIKSFAILIKMQCQGSILLFKIIKLFQFFFFNFQFFLPVQKHLFLLGRRSRNTQMFLSSEIGLDFASSNSKDG